MAVKRGVLKTGLFSLVVLSTSLFAQDVPQGLPPGYTPLPGPLPLQGGQQVLPGGYTVQGGQQQRMVPPASSGLYQQGGVPKQSQIAPQGSLCPPEVVAAGKCSSVSSPQETKGDKQQQVQKDIKQPTRKKEEPYVPLKRDELSEGKVVEGVYYVVSPEKTTMVQLSNVDVNRIVCPVPIQDVVYSEEKGVKIKVVDRNAFVKFQVKKVEDEFEYATTPVDIHVVCNGKVYSIVAFPKKIPAVLVYLEDRDLTLKKNLEGFSELSFEEKVAKIVKDIFSGKIPPGAEYKVFEKRYDVFKDLELIEKARYVYDGEGLEVRFFTVKYIGNGTHVDLHERLFLKKEITVRPLAISLGRLRLNKGEATELVLIEKKAVDTQF